MGKKYFYYIFINKYSAVLAKLGRILSKMKNRNSDFKNRVSNSVFGPKKPVFRIRFLTGQKHYSLLPLCLSSFSLTAGCYNSVKGDGGEDQKSSFFFLSLLLRPETGRERRIQRSEDKKDFFLSTAVPQPTFFSNHLLENDNELQENEKSAFFLSSILVTFR